MMRRDGQRNTSQAGNRTNTESATRSRRKGGAAQSRPSDDPLRELTDKLKENLGKSANDPDEDAVHDTRTGTRRIEAALEAMLRGMTDEQSELGKAVRDWERLLKTIRRAAAPVRDLDVQRKLLKKLVPVVEVETKTPVEEPESGMGGQVDRLDHAMKSEREHNAQRLKKNAAKWAAKLDAHREEVAAARPGAGRGRRPDAAATALEAFARLADHMRQLDAGNLHDFRKGAKKARYMAEQGQDERAKAVGKALKRLQDEIGDWHDWLMLAEEAHKYLDAGGTKLTAEIERMRDVHFEMAMKMEQKMRGRLIGEGLALRAPRGRSRSTLRTKTYSQGPRSWPRNWSLSELRPIAPARELEADPLQARRIQQSREKA